MQACSKDEMSSFNHMIEIHLGYNGSHMPQYSFDQKYKEGSECSTINIHGGLLVLIK